MAGVDAEATSSCEGRRKDKRGVEVDGTNLCSCVHLAVGCGSQSTAHVENCADILGVIEPQSSVFSKKRGS